MGPILGSLLPTLIGGGLSALGSLLRPKPKPTVVTQEAGIDFAKLRSDAESAGFNPDFAIRFGALGGYTRTTTTESAQPDTRLSDALYSFGTAFANWDPYAGRRAQADIGLQRAMTGYYAQGALSLGGSGGGFGNEDAGRFRLMAAQQTPQMAFGGALWPTAPDTVDAQSFEDRYGEILGWIAGVGIAFRDLIYNLDQPGPAAAIESGVRGAAASFDRYTAGVRAERASAGVWSDLERWWDNAQAQERMRVAPNAIDGGVRFPSFSLQ